MSFLERFCVDLRLSEDTKYHCSARSFVFHVRIYFTDSDFSPQNKTSIIKKSRISIDLAGLSLKISFAAPIHAKFVEMVGDVPPLHIFIFQQPYQNIDRLPLLFTKVLRLLTAYSKKIQL